VVYGLDYTGMMEQQGDIGFRITGIIRSAWNYSSMVFAAISMPIITAITAWFPARRGVKKSIADTLRFE
ncbi:MAG: ABC transporter permease, partial [Spirochaetes bacterium]|nr:ABC transporter permease [Spirochaetota bacterium]